MKPIRTSVLLASIAITSASYHTSSAALLALYQFEGSTTADVNGSDKIGTHNGSTFNGTDLGGTSLSTNTPTALSSSTQSLSLSGSATGGIAIGAALGGLVPMLNSQTDWTIAMWMRTSATDDGPLFSATWGNHLPNRDQTFYVRDNGTLANDTNQVAAVTHGSNYNDGNWHFVAITHVGGATSYTQTVYVDDGAGGTLTSTGNTINSSWDTSLDPNINVVIGNYINNPNIPGGFQGVLDHFTGNLDDVAIFDQALTEAQLDEIRIGNYAGFLIPEPSSTILFGLAGSAFVLRRRRQ